MTNTTFAKRDIEALRNQLDAIAVYAERARDRIGNADVALNSDLDKAGMNQTWILQAVKEALHVINRVGA